MNYSYDLWDFSQQTPPIRFTQPYDHIPHLLNEDSEQELISRLLLQNEGNEFFHVSNQEIEQPTPNQPISLRPRRPQTMAQFPRPEERRDRRRRKTKPSPFHNYQKHLNIALKHMLVVDEPALDGSAEIIIAYELWKHFVNSESSTKKILHYIFNERNEYSITGEELSQFGLMQVYQLCRGQQLNGAKNFLTKLAIQQLADPLIDEYLKTRRIKNTPKFKKYLQVFRKELEDGFIKKRFTNKVRRAQQEDK